MSSSIEEQFDPPEWATKEEVIKAARHYINYWKVEAKARNGQWLESMNENGKLRIRISRLERAGGNLCDLVGNHELNSKAVKQIQAAWDKIVEEGKIK